MTTALADPQFFRRTRPTEPDVCLVEPALLVVAQNVLTSPHQWKHRSAVAVGRMKLNYAEPLRGDHLAARAQMSASTFHQHFRDLSTMSPLQYQKWPRLNEAQQLMPNERLDAASAPFKVGYESPSQFSREWSRLFGRPPKRDIDRLQREMAGGRPLPKGD